MHVYKPWGMTPLQVLDALRKSHPEYQNESMTYAGRLDPMAEGVLVVLVGEAVHEKEKYMQYDKIYEADIVLGLGTDTHDLLGLPSVYAMNELTDERINAAVAEMKGVFEYPYPAYSSKPINGKPLFQWAREERLDEIEIPKRTMRVHEVTLLDRWEVSVQEIEKKIEGMNEAVRGDFRQREISERWKATLASIDQKTALPAVRVRIRCASGTYIRTLAHELGKRLGCDAILVRLVRTHVGDYDTEEAMRIQ